MSARISSAMERALKAWRVSKGTESIRSIAQRCGVSLRGLQYAIKREG